MSTFKETFTNRHAVLPVIHVESVHQTMENARIAHKEGADGVFLISMHGMNHKDLLEMHGTVRAEFSAWFVGVNYLDKHIVDVFDSVNSGVSGVWTDNSEIDERSSQQFFAERIEAERKKSGFSGLYFGGVAFKYQRPVENVALAAQIASRYMDVVTTSGEGTGNAPDPQKIAIMKAAIGEHPLGIASGMSPENIEKFLPVADAFLVATSIIGKDEMFDPSRVRDLVQTVRGYKVS